MIKWFVYERVNATRNSGCTMEARKVERNELRKSYEQ
jgi:hypothetical protein